MIIGQQTKAIKQITDTWRKTNHNAARKAERKLTPELVEKSKRLEELKNPMTYPGESDPLEP